MGFALLWSCILRVCNADGQRWAHLERADELVRTGVDTTIGEQTDEVHCVLSEGWLDVLPAIAIEHGACLKGDVYQACTLVDNLPSAQGVVPNL